MKKFLEDNGVLYTEIAKLQNRVILKFGWSYQQWQRRLCGRTALTEPERICMLQILQEIRSKNHSQEPESTEQPEYLEHFDND